MIYLINYDLHNPGKNYDSLIRAIQSYSDWAKISRSCWMVRCDFTATEIRDHLMQHLDDNDILLVCSVGSWATLNFNQDVIAWLNN